MIHLRTGIAYEMSQAQDIPRDIIWLRRGTIVLIALLGFVLFIFALRALMQAPLFAIHKLKISGDTQLHNSLTLRANVVPQMRGHFFNLDLHQAQAAFESLPGIRNAIVKREFPDQLRVKLVAHEPAAKWISVDKPQDHDAGIERLVNIQGEVFESSGGALDTENLPTLAGPQNKSAEVLNLFLSLEAALQTSHQSIEQLTLSNQGMWRAILGNQTKLELGSGSKPDIMARFNRWLTAHAVVTEKYGKRTAQTVDLRYRDGFAIRLTGVTTR
jgi:cell division protein FtsQ